MTRPVIIDTDPGVDDAMAIALALASPELDVVALTTVFGNHWTSETTRNALIVARELGQPDLPVVRGAERPLARVFDRPATFVHGGDGMGDAGFDPPTATALAGRRAAEYLVGEIRSRPGELTLVPVGPLTNIALAVLLEPDIVPLVREVVIMGGAALAAGNVTPSAEANIIADPEAAVVVFGAGWPVTMVGLDVTEQVLVHDDWLHELSQHTTPSAELLSAIIGPYREFHGDLGGIHGHDALAVAHLIDPEILTVESLPLLVSTSGVTDGATIVARRSTNASEWADAAPVHVATEVDTPRALDLLLTRLTS